MVWTLLSDVQGWGCGCQYTLNPEPSKCSFIPLGNFGKLANDQLLCGIFGAKTTVCNREMWNSIWYGNGHTQGKTKNILALLKVKRQGWYESTLLPRLSNVGPIYFLKGFWLFKLNFNNLMGSVMGKHFYKHFLFDNLSSSFFISSDNLEAL